MNEYIQEKIQNFKKWCTETTATFESQYDPDGYGEDFNVSFSELSFYEDLLKKHQEEIENAYNRGVEDALKCVPEKFRDRREIGDFYTDSETLRNIDTVNRVIQQTIDNISKLKTNK